MPTLLPLLLLPLASCQLTEVLRHGSIFGWARDAALWADELPWYARVPLTPLRALNCGFCFSHWATVICIGLVFCGEPGLWILAGLAATRVANLINDLTKPWSRTPGTRSATDIMKEVSTEHLEEEFIRRTSRPFGIPPGSVPQGGPEDQSPGQAPARH
jgi:hypothetical protein